MGTAALVFGVYDSNVIESEDNTTQEMAYIHYDGYVSGVGLTLLEKAVEQQISLNEVVWELLTVGSYYSGITSKSFEEESKEPQKDGIQAEILTDTKIRNLMEYNNAAEYAYVARQGVVDVFTMVYKDGKSHFSYKGLLTPELVIGEIEMDIINMKNNTSVSRIYKMESLQYLEGRLEHVRSLKEQMECINGCNK